MMSVINVLFAAATHAGQADHFAQRDFDINILEVCFTRTFDDDGVAITGAALFRHINLQATRRYAPVRLSLTFMNLLGCAFRHDAPTIFTRARPQDQSTSPPCAGLLVMFDHEKGNCPSPRISIRVLNQLGIIALVQTNRRLIQHIQTPVKRLPICVARRIRCASPPLSDPADRDRLR